MRRRSPEIDVCRRGRLPSRPERAPTAVRWPR